MSTWATLCAGVIAAKRASAPVRNKDFKTQRRRHRMKLRVSWSFLFLLKNLLLSRERCRSRRTPPENGERQISNVFGRCKRFAWFRAKQTMSRRVSVHRMLVIVVAGALIRGLAVVSGHLGPAA